MPHFMLTIIIYKFQILHEKIEKSAVELAERASIGKAPQNAQSFLNSLLDAVPCVVHFYLKKSMELFTAVRRIPRINVG